MTELSAGLVRRSPYITRSKGQARRSQPLPTATEGWQSPETMETSDLVIVRWRAVLSDVPRAAGGRPSQPDRSWTSSCTGSARTSASAEPRPGNIARIANRCGCSARLPGGGRSRPARLRRSRWQRCPALPRLAPLAAAEGGGERILSWPGAASERPFRYASSSPDGLSNRRADRVLYRRLSLACVREALVEKGSCVVDM